MTTVMLDGEELTEAAATVSLTRKRIVIYGMNYAPELAGVGKYTGEIGEYLAAEGADVTVVTTPPHYPGWTVQPGFRNAYSRTMENGVKVLRTPLLLRAKMKGIWRLLAPLSFAVTSAPVVFWQIVRHRPATVFCVEPTLFAAPVAQLAAKLVGGRTVLHVQDLEVDAAFAVGHLGALGFLKKLGFAFERFTLKRFDKIITISNRMAEKLVEKGVAGEDVTIVRNWVDLSHIYPMTEESPYRAEQGFTKDDFVVLYSGNVGAKQGLTVLLDAAEQLRGEKNIHFVIAGEGPLKAELQARYGTLPNLRFLPFQPYARLNEFLNMADLHALPQDRGVADLVLPSKVAGMLASGKPILAMVENGTELGQFLKGVSIILPPGNVDALCQAVRAHIEHPEQRRNANDIRERSTHLSKVNIKLIGQCCM
ncbi:colanic acid biosynthesis glycosyl transferase WcaI [Neorhizobium galegae]|uniref:WcaI family glycosyltransferase n=1 Tax=Neorhizobium galegae TaxID=399 RepID=UPI001AE94E41|nr:WcaI family glycosyltransferase [Neorhizobium galegae]MBP2550532.1 colanic acid biosynthesis glycosyl transferase WcaI [Neorhizobium galegae]